MPIFVEVTAHRYNDHVSDWRPCQWHPDEVRSIEPTAGRGSPKDKSLVRLGDGEVYVTTETPDEITTRVVDALAWRTILAKGST